MSEISTLPAGPNRLSPPMRRFEFGRDTFAFANELLWEYTFDSASGKMRFSQRQPKPDYTHRCFVLVRAARQFFGHARFVNEEPRANAATYRQLIRAVLSRDPRKACPGGREIRIPGFAGLREFSKVYETLLKTDCGGAWRSYAMRSHWRMVFPISREMQARMSAQLTDSLRRHDSAIVHLFRFPALTINHGMLLFNMTETSDGPAFEAYDPNEPGKSVWVSFDRQAQTFTLPPTRYWAGGPLDVLEIYRTWWL